MKHGLNEAIARELILAQAASDGGKHIKDLLDLTPYVPGLRKAYKKGYPAKEDHMRNAVAMIKTAHGRSGFSFYETKDPKIQYRTNDMTLVYFNFKVDGIRYQISFHSPGPIEIHGIKDMKEIMNAEYRDCDRRNSGYTAPGIKDRKEFMNARHKTHWDRKDSRYAARVLAEKIFK